MASRHETHDDLYEKLGTLHGKMQGLSDLIDNANNKLDVLGGKMDDLTISVTGLKTKAALISGIIATGATLVVTTAWNVLTGK